MYLVREREREKERRELPSAYSVPSTHTHTEGERERRERVRHFLLLHREAVRAEDHAHTHACNDVVFLDSWLWREKRSSGCSLGERGRGTERSNFLAVCTPLFVYTSPPRYRRTAVHQHMNTLPLQKFAVLSPSSAARGT